MWLLGRRLNSIVGLGVVGVYLDSFTFFDCLGGDFLSLISQVLLCSLECKLLLTLLSILYYFILL